MLIALDTNILAYAEGIGDKSRCSKAIVLIEQLPSELILLPAQTLGELYRVLTSKAQRDAAFSRHAIMTWVDTFEVADSSWSAFQSALDLAVAHHVQIWDALVLSVAAENHCRMLLSEDFQNGFIWRGVTLVNPFVDPVPPVLARFL